MHAVKRSIAPTNAGGSFTFGRGRGLAGGGPADAFGAEPAATVSAAFSSGRHVLMAFL